MADIGTDHAYLPVSLILSGRISRAIAADIRPGPLEHARRTAEEYGVSERLDFRLCDGLAGIAPQECDTVAVAGMGGETIAGILAQAPWAGEGKRLILQPQSTQNVLRRFLVENDYCILSEQVVREGDRWYPVLLVQGGEMAPLTPAEEMAGRSDTWQPQPERRDYLEWLLKRTQTQLNGLRRSAKPGNGARLRELAQAEQELIRWIGPSGRGEEA